MKYFFLFFLFILSLKGICQLQGTVLDKETNNQIPFANVWIENEIIGTTSDRNGIFRFSESYKGKNLIISAVGYESRCIIIDSLSLKILLVPKIYLIPEIIVTPKKKTELVICQYNTAQIYNYTGCTIPQIFARYFPYKDEYQSTPFIKSIRLKTYSKIESCFNLRFLTVNPKGEPGTDIIKDNLVIRVKKGRRNLVIDNFNSTQIQIPQQGLFIAVEFLIIKENEMEMWGNNIDTNKKVKATTYMPFIGAQKNEDFNNGWVYTGGKWENNEFGSIFAKMTKRNIKYCIAMEVILRD